MSHNKIAASWERARICNLAAQPEYQHEVKESLTRTSYRLILVPNYSKIARTIGRSASMVKKVLHPEVRDAHNLNRRWNYLVDPETRKQAALENRKYNASREGREVRLRIRRRYNFNNYLDCRRGIRAVGRVFDLEAKLD